MFEKDNAESMVQAAVREVKSSVTLVSDNQSPKYSGHESGEYGQGGPDAGGPSSSAPGTKGY